jgi:hypothetical protein
MTGPVALPRKKIKLPTGGRRITIHRRLVEVELEEEDLSRVLDAIKHQDVEVEAEELEQKKKISPRKRKRGRKR